MKNHDHRERPSNPEPIIINDLVLNTEICGWLFAEDVQNRTAKNGKQYRQLKLRDQRGNDITARHFDLPQKESNAPQAGKGVLIKGLIEEYQNNIQLKLTYAELDESAPLDVFVIRTVDRLLEHTVHVALITQFLTILYSCNQELALAGALLHDIGKLRELEEQPGRGFTPVGPMFGHIFLGTQYVEQHTKHVVELDEATRLDLLHIILAHHGTKEFGSPVYPATIEALIVHLADLTEAKLTGFLDHCDRTSAPDGWTSYYKDFGGPLRVP